MLIGIDNCSDAEMIVTGYNDPKGVTSRFIMEGVDHAGRTLHGRVQGGGLNSDNFEYVTRWNQVLGRHEVRENFLNIEERVHLLTIASGRLTSDVRSTDLLSQCRQSEELLPKQSTSRKTSKSSAVPRRLRTFPSNADLAQDDSHRILLQVHAS